MNGYNHAPLMSLTSAARTIVRDRLLSTNWGYDAYMRRRWNLATREVPRAPWMNSALKTQGEIDAAVAEVHRLNLPASHDPGKDWDSLAALREIVTRTTPNASVLDAGAEMYSRLLPWLYLYGYRTLRGINLAFPQAARRGPIVYEPGDITATGLPNASIDAATCLSVIEHGVNLDAYFKEMARLLKPGGVLVTSTDYFETPTDTKGLSAYGVPIHIFTKTELLEAADVARRHGLELTGPLDTTCRDRLVTWEPYGLSYTFTVFAMTKAR
jgi:SAM-dependent methyltransferase